LVKYVNDHTPHTELLALIAEEASELTHAALKFRRVLDGTNPTPVTAEDACDALVEEIADVLLLICPNDKELSAEIREIQDRKLRRWADRIAQKEINSDQY
jgi:NTP pyrophosphatase (non-canonical NTP hydrolase)